MYRVNAVDSRKPRDGRVLEELGWFNPNEKDASKQSGLNAERLLFWLSKGAQPSDTVADLLRRTGIVKK